MSRKTFISGMLLAALFFISSVRYTRAATFTFPPSLPFTDSGETFTDYHAWITTGVNPSDKHCIIIFYNSSTQFKSSEFPGTPSGVIGNPVQSGYDSVHGDYGFGVDGGHAEQWFSGDNTCTSGWDTNTNFSRSEPHLDSSNNFGAKISGNVTIFSRDSRNIEYNGVTILTGDNPYASSTPFYAEITNAATSSLNLYSGTSTSSVVQKILPIGWSLYVSTTTDDSGRSITNSGYRWYNVTDLTDNVSGWMTAANASGTQYYLSFDPNKQTQLQASIQVIATSSRSNLVLDVINHYFNNASTSYSLYSSDDGSSLISVLNENGYPKKVIWGISARESAVGFNNQYVANDFGHGIMMPTFIPNDYDHRGEYSFVKLSLCQALGTSAYLDCYTATSTNGRSYKVYQDNPSNPTYKQYTNAQQSIYSNIKDGMGVLAKGFSEVPATTTDFVRDGITYTSSEQGIILATEKYNGNRCGYVDDVATTLDNITSYFASADVSDIAGLISKMHSAGSDAICIDLYSPAHPIIKDSHGRTLGIIKNKVVNEFPLAVYDSKRKFAKILLPDKDAYTFEVVGEKTGMYGIDITFKNGKDSITFKGRGIPTHLNERHIYKVDKMALQKGQNGVQVQIDPKGDGNIKKTFTAGLTLTGTEF